MMTLMPASQFLKCRFRSMALNINLFSGRAVRLLRQPLDIGVVVLALCFLLPTQALAQVDNIKRNVEADKSSGSSSQPAQRSSGGGGDDDSGSDWSADFTENLVANAVIGIGYGVFYLGSQWQQYAISQRDRHPELVSIEASANVLIDANEGTIGYLPVLQLNGGAFATQLRFAHVEDYSGALNSFDWQVVKVRLPIANLKLEYGIGFIALLEPSATYFESAIGFDWRFLKQRANLQSEYRWSQNTNLGTRYRQEYNVVFDYETKQWGKFRLSPLVGYTFQNYFESDIMRFVNVGLRLRFY